MLSLIARTGPSTRLVYSAVAMAIRPFSTTNCSNAPNQMPLLETDLSFIRHNPPHPKPRKKSLTEIRASYYSVIGPRYLADVLDTMGLWVDGLKFAGGSYTLFPERQLREVIDLAHSHDVYVSTGGSLTHEYLT